MKVAAYSLLISLLLCSRVAWPQQSSHDEFLVISVRGSISEQQSRKIVAQLFSVQPTIRYIVVAIDCDGGVLPDVLSVAEALSHAPATTIAYVKKAMSSAIFLVARCDRIVADSRAVAGGAGVVSRDFVALSDSLFLAVRNELTQRIENDAKEKHHDPQVFAAMINPVGQLIRNGRIWKRDGEILSLTGKEMVSIGLAQSEWASIESFLEALPKMPNQALEPTTPAVMIPAAQGVTPAGVVAHL